jgi:hypothetical protein
MVRDGQAGILDCRILRHVGKLTIDWQVGKSRMWYMSVYAMEYHNYILLSINFLLHERRIEHSLSLLAALLARHDKVYPTKPMHDLL